MQFTLFLPLFSLLSVSHTELWRPRVYKGVLDTKNEFPFAVSLQASISPFKRVCTASLIAATWVITAAHCFMESTLPKKIRYANFTQDPEKTRAYVNIVHIFKHPHSNAEYIIKNDIALIFTEKVPNTAFGKISAVDYMALIGLPVKYAGFGVADKTKVAQYYTTDDMKRPLQLGEAVVIPCDHNYEVLVGPAICVAPKCSNKLQDSRQGDSGGPLVFDGKIIGVLIGGPDTEENISWYAPLSPNLEWILDTMNKQ